MTKECFACKREFTNGYPQGWKCNKCVPCNECGVMLLHLADGSHTCFNVGKCGIADDRKVFYKI